MLAQSNVYAIAPAADLQRARTFYREMLGLEPVSEEMMGVLLYQTGEGSTFIIYETPSAGTAQNTAFGWDVSDVDAEVAALREKGVKFEEYDMPGLKTENGIATAGGVRAAWFKDSEGNILSVTQRMNAS